MKDRNVHRQIAPGEFIYFNSYSTKDKTGYQFSYEKFEDKKLVFKVISNRILWDSTSSKWKLENYFIRNIDSTGESIRKGYRMDTTFAFHPKEFSRRIRFIQAMDNGELDDYIKKERLRGSENIPFYLVERHKRGSYPFATFILTIIGVSVASRKVRGGIGMQIGLGLFLSFTYILFMQVTTTFATNGNVPALIAVWIPNIVFTVIALFLLRNAPK
ncbi:MAG: YjgP/YjgQ family permease [Bacteroidia bacterium]|nr:YjgP/YjgQ family permease [Bacteroidia bacterium]